MYTSFISNNYSNVSDQDTTSYQTITVSDHSMPFTSVTDTNWSDISNRITWLKKCDGTVFSTDDIITKTDIMDENFLWKQLFNTICQANPNKMPDYMTTFKLYSEDYKQTVLAIETAKKEV